MDVMIPSGTTAFGMVKIAIIMRIKLHTRRDLNSGYINGYADAVCDTEGLETEEIDPFKMQLITNAFEDWV